MTSLLAYPRISAAGFLAAMLRRLLLCSNIPKDSTFGSQTQITKLGCPEQSTYIELELEEDDRFFILSFENKFRSRPGNTSDQLIGYQERCKIYSNEDPVERRRKKMKKRGNDHKKFKESENWSPVSNLDNDMFTTTSSDLSTPEEEIEELTSPNSIIKLSKLEEYKLSTLVDGRQIEIWDEIEKVCNEEIDESRWIYRTNPKLQDVEDMGEELEDDIMGDLLGELIVEMNVGMMSLL